MKRIFLSLCGLCVYTICGIAQNELDVLRYSRLGLGGTARFTSMAGAMGALGGDATVLSYNPAGLGVFRRSDLTFTPSLFTNKGKSEDNGTTSENTRYNFNFGNLAFVFPVGLCTNIFLLLIFIFLFIVVKFYS